MPLTEKELSWIEDQLDHEQVMINKFTEYAEMTTDPQLKSLCQEIAQRHENHFNTLLQHLKTS